MTTNGPPGCTAEAANFTAWVCISTVAAGLEVGSNSEPCEPAVMVTLPPVPLPTGVGPSVPIFLRLPATTSRSVALFGTTVSPTTFCMCTGTVFCDARMRLYGSPESSIVWKSRK